jgi:uncharacterized protein (TIGR02452 family)
MTNRSHRATIAKETLEILRRGFYVNNDGAKVDVHNSLHTAMESTVHYAPDDFNDVYADRNRILSHRDPHQIRTKFRVVNATTLATARELIEHPESVDPVVCLNFASAKNPGGGFLGGSQAQEESLARASALYPCINEVTDYYETNRQKSGSGVYTDHMIYSPSAPVFRDDDDRLLRQPYSLGMITAPAVNAGALLKKDRSRRRAIEPTMRRRIQHVLSIAIVNNHKRIVLGAWGCGVFRNDPADIALWFADELKNNPRLNGAFETVVFAVLDRTNRGTFKAFESVFGA